MQLQPVTYRGRTVAVATARRYFLSGELACRPVTDPERTFVVFMAAYARDVAAGLLSGPYRDEDARLFARTCLIPAELLERPGLDTERAAAALGVPSTEFKTQQGERLW